MLDHNDLEEAMSRIPYLVAASVAGIFAASSVATAQSAAPTAPHMIVVQLVENHGGMPYAFEPSNVTAQRGDTLRFVQASTAPHNVRFSKQAKGAKLGGAASGPYLTAKGQTYDLVIDGRFTDGSYAFVCDPHEAIGMQGTLTVAASTK
jgi:plastocyanin